MAEFHQSSLVWSRACAWRGSAALACALLAIALGPAASAQLVKVGVAGDAPRNGIFDPSVEYDPATGTGWLVYSAVFGNADPWGPNVETHLARSDDGGASWTFVQAINLSTPTTVDIPGEGLVSGFWNYEVASLVYDPGAPGAEWKLFAHRIFRRDALVVVGEQSEPAFSWIVLRTAPQPDGPWSAERALFKSGSFPPPPYAPGAIVVEDLDPSLQGQGLIVYSEPGSFERGGTLYLSLSGLTASGPDRILLLASDDHATSWRFVATPLTNADAPPLGYSSFDGTAIAGDQGRTFLLATPESPGVLNDGTLAFEFESLEQGSLVRAAGVPVIHLSLPAQPGLPPDRRGGQADYHAANAVGGLLQPALQAGQLPELFQFSSTGVRLVAPRPLPGPGGAGFAVTCVAIALAALRGLSRSSRRRASRSQATDQAP